MKATQPQTNPPKGDSLAEKAQTLLKANFLNLARKLQEGKTLSAYEVELLRQESGAPVKHEPKWAKNQTELGEQLGVTRKTIQRWRKEPGFPAPASNGNYDVNAVKAWQARRDGTVTEDNEPTQAMLKARNLLLQNEKLEFQVNVLRKEYIPRSSARRVWTQFINSAKIRSFSAVSRIVTLARMATDTTDATVKVREEMIEIWRELEKGEWQQTPPSP
jgi:hypothetical protein